MPEAGAGPRSYAPDAPIAERREGRQVLLWPERSEPMRELARQLGFFGFRPSLLADASTLLTALAGQQDGFALLDMAEARGQAETWRQQLRQLATDHGVIAIAADGDMDHRLAAVHLGCRAYLTRPFDIAQLLDAMDRIYGATQGEGGRVLIVEDSRSMAALYSRVLHQAGFVTRTVTDPLQALAVLEEWSTELILMDMYMPGASGEELAQVIRQQDAFLSIPIVFLSSEADIGRQFAAMALGADEFLQKPIQPDHLATAVRSRIVRYRNLRALMVRDSLTGLLNHTTFKERLRGEVARSCRGGRPLSLAMLDIDHFKAVNDSHGHPVGDLVIKSLAMLLRRRLRASDVVARYGGEEFAIALPETPLEAAQAVLEDICRVFSEIDHAAAGETFRCTLSAGVAQCPPRQDAELMVQAADAALYVAKRSGRNRVVSHGDIAAVASSMPPA